MVRAIVIVSLLSLAIAGDAVACGDKLVQIGRGVRFQRAKSIHPAIIVMVAGPQFDQHAARQLQSELMLAGHKVDIVAETDALGPLLQSRHVDIVLSDLQSLASVTQSVEGALSRPRLIPMLDRPQTPPEIEQRFPLVMLTWSRGLDQLAMISNAMK